MERVDFSKDVYPLFKRSCFECHGPSQQAGGLRLDSRAGALGGKRVVIRPGKPESSELLRRISLAKGHAGVMPARGDVLEPQQIALIRDWIRQGASWPAQVSAAQHWSYVPPRRPPLPRVSNVKWCRNPIDYFIMARLDRAGLRPSPEAERAVLLRRVSLDLTGLPPSPAELDAFLADNSPTAYEKVVDRLLASPEFGPRWARPWLDLARYADSHGFQRDDLREIWPYRDWVINALNADMPFDQFTIEQLAGDLLVAEATGRRENGSTPLTADLQSKLIATGFHRNAPTNVEAGTEPEETRTNQVIDRVNTTAAVWLGSTLECAQCHDHKYDPISQSDYFRFFAYFNSTALEADRADPKAPGSIRFLGPSLPINEPSQQAEQARLTAGLAEIDRQIAARKSALSADPAWEAALSKQVGQGVEEHPLEILDFDSAGGSPHRMLPDSSVLLVDEAPDRDTYTIRARGVGKTITGFKLEALTDPSLPGMGPGRGDAVRPNFVLNTFAVAGESPTGGSPMPIRLRNARADFSQANMPVAGAIDNDPKTAWAINPRFHTPHWATFETEKPVVLSEGAFLRFTLVQNYGGGRTIGRLRLSALSGAPGTATLPAAVAQALRVPREQRSATQRDALLDFALLSDSEALRLRSDRAALDTRLKGLRPASTLVMQELPLPRKSYVFRRGAYTDRGPEVSPGTPSVFGARPDTPAGASPSRLGLARWLVSPGNPLVGRVTVNRWWAELFGHGIVRTVEDFGVKGEPPTHPELLDWLAAWFGTEERVNETMGQRSNGKQEGGRTGTPASQRRIDPLTHSSIDPPPGAWRLKRLLRLIVTSATYRQSSRVTPALLARDDQNRLYARGPRFRLDAEAIRDNALAVAGLLSRKQGGPPVRPYQPDGLWTKIGGDRVDYVTSPGEDRYRRGVYVVWKRAAPYPSFMNFDASARLACTVKRSRSNTPLQALTLLNDPVYVEAAAALARRVITECPAPDLEARLHYAFRLCLARTPAVNERQVLRRLYAARLQAGTDAAGAQADPIVAELRPASVPAAEFEAWHAVSTALLNLDEMVTKG